GDELRRAGGSLRRTGSIDARSSAGTGIADQGQLHGARNGSVRTPHVGASRSAPDDVREDWRFTAGRAHTRNREKLGRGVARRNERLSHRTRSRCRWRPYGAAIRCPLTGICHPAHSPTAFPTTGQLSKLMTIWRWNVIWRKQSMKRLGELFVGLAAAVG